MKKVACIIAIMFLTVMFAGCASTSSSVWAPDTSSGLKGKTESEVISALGKPFKKSVNIDGVKILEYRRACPDRSGMNTYVSIGSFGLLSAEKSAYIDILKLYFKKDVVDKFSYDENVMGLLL